MQQDIVTEVINHWSEVKKRNPSFSLRSFSKKINIPHSALSEILNGKRKITKKMAERLVLGLELDAEKHNSILEKFEQGNSYSLVDLEKFNVISKWENLGVLGLFKLKRFRGDQNWIAKKIGIKESQVTLILARLKKLGLVVEDHEGKISRSENINLKTSHQIENEALKRFTVESLEKGIESVYNDSINKRDFSTVSLSVLKKDIPKAKKLLEEFRYKFDKEMEVVPGDELYKLILGFYPVSKEIDE